MSVAQHDAVASTFDSEFDDAAGGADGRNTAAAMGAAMGAAGAIATGSNRFGVLGAAIASGLTGYVTGGSGVGGRTVICTHFHEKGLLDHELWRIDSEFSATSISASTIRGYHFWAIPFVRFMRRNPWVERFVLPLVIARSKEVAFRAGKRSSGSLLGRAVRVVGEPTCSLIGHFVRPQAWDMLWTGEYDMDRRALK